MLRSKLYKKMPNFDIDLEIMVENGEIHALMGPIGCGKTTFLNMVAGLVEPDAGVIESQGTLLYCNEKKINIPSFQRRVGYVFQKSALFPHMTVKENIIYAFAKYDEKMFNELVNSLNLQKLLNGYPKQISGGESQKVALARVMASKPQILLLDEPFASLDSSTRRDLQDLIIGISYSKSLPIILVTHDQDEAKRMATKISYIKEGKVIQTEL